MNLKEFVRDKYPIGDRIRRMKEDPITQVMENDDLPYDEIKLVDGIYQKVVMLDDTEYIAITDLLMLTKEEVDQMKDESFKQVYKAFMENVEVEIVDINNISNSLKELDSMKKRKQELLGRLS